MCRFDEEAIYIFAIGGPIPLHRCRTFKKTKTEKVLEKQTVMQQVRAYFRPHHQDQEGSRVG